MFFHSASPHGARIRKDDFFSWGVSDHQVHLQTLNLPYIRRARGSVTQAYQIFRCQ